MSPFQAVRRGALPLATIPEARRSSLTERFAELARESENWNAESQEMCGALLRLLLGEVRRSMASPPLPVPPGFLVGDALEFIQGHCFEAISLRHVAAAVHRSPAHVASAVKRATGRSVGGWIAAARMAEAATRLLQTDDRVDEIGRRVGWQDVTHFIRQFKKAHGVTPAAWRAQHRPKHGRG